MSEPKLSTFPDKSAGAIAYITVVPAIAFLILVPTRRALCPLHAWQSIFLNFFALVISYALIFVLSYFGVSG